MASGALLLAQLKSRRAGAPEPALRPPLPVVPPPIPLPGAVPQAAGVPGSSRVSHARIIVCNGVDCGGLGAGAALLEIEVLVAEHSSLTSTATAVFGVCTLQCANAPVVNVLRNGCSNALDASAEHYSCVNSASRAEAVVKTALRCEPDAADTRASVMMRRADGMRFDALKQVARVVKPHGGVGPHRSSSREAHRLLRAALQAEAAAARGCAIRLARAERRATRLMCTAGLNT
jgi:hypothetical protein